MFFRNLKEPLEVLHFMITMISTVTLLQHNKQLCLLDSKYELTSPRATHLAPDDEGGGGWHWLEYWQNVCWCGRAHTETQGSGDTQPPPGLQGKC